MRALVFALVAAVVALPVVAATPWTLGVGTKLLYDGENESFTIATPTDASVTTLTFADDGAPSIDGLVIDITTASAGSWNITTLSSTVMVLRGNLTTGGSFHITGSATSYYVDGVASLGTLVVPGNGGYAPYPLAAGEHTITITTVGGAAGNIAEGVASGLGFFIPLMFAAAALVVLAGVFVVAARG